MALLWRELVLESFICKAIGRRYLSQQILVTTPFWLKQFSIIVIHYVQSTPITQLPPSHQIWAIGSSSTIALHPYRTYKDHQIFPRLLQHML